MNICSHQRSLITVSGNSQFNIPAGKVSRNSKTLDNELESCPRMKTVSFYHSLILKHFCKWAKLDVVTNGQKFGGGGGGISLWPLLTLQDSVNGWREKSWRLASSPAAWPFSWAASFQSMTAPSVQYLRVPKDGEELLGWNFSCQHL